MNDSGCRLTSENRLALLMHDCLGEYRGKMGDGLLRYSAAPTVAVIDHSKVGRRIRELTGIESSAPVVGSVREALECKPDTLVLAISPPGGIMPDGWFSEIKEAVAAGLNLVNGLHAPLADHPEIEPRSEER